MAESGQVLTLQAPAKVNLTLQILAKRADGYHELDSRMQKLDLFDTVRVQLLESPGISLRCPDSGLPADDSNLVHKAAALFLEEAGVDKNRGVSLVLEKRIPVAAGLGGGSSDAAAVLCALNQLFDTPVSQEKLLELAKELGADVPFFVFPEAAVRARGIGERMEAVPSLSHCSVLLVNPGFSVSTAWVFKNFRLTRVDNIPILSDSRKNGSLNRVSLDLFNDLETVTIDRYPEIASIKESMFERGASGALMSGSGPTVFGVFPDDTDGDVQGCADLLGKKYGDGVFVTRPL